MRQQGGSYGGLAFGPGTPYPVVAVEGLDDLPGVRVADQARPADDGDHSGVDYAGPRTVTFTLGVQGTSPTDLEAKVAALVQAVTVARDVQPLYVRDSTRLVWAKPRRRRVPYDAQHYARLGTAVVEFYCPDPRVFDAVLRSPVLSLPQADTGRTYPLIYDLAYGPVGVLGAVQMVNDGNVHAEPTVRFSGPVTNPGVENLTTGERLDLSLVLAAGEWVEVDTDGRTVLLNGTASRRNAVRPGSRFITLAPGVNEVVLRASAYDPAATATVLYRSAWL